MDLKECIGLCRNCSLTGWELVGFVNRIVCENMAYSTSNPLDFPSRAFSRHKGYCVQQAFCIRKILKAVGIHSEMVYCTKAEFPDGNDIRVSAHTWCRVTIGNTTKDICTCDKTNTPGSVNFKPISPVKAYTPIIAVGGYLGSIPVCIVRSYKQKQSN